MFRKVKKQLERKREGKSSTKFRFEVTNLRLEGVMAPGLEEVRVVWSKGAKLQMTNIQTLDNGKASFDDTLFIVSSVYRDQKGHVEPKTYSVKIQYPAKGDQKNMQTYAKVELDMAKFAGVGDEKHAIELTLPTKQGGVAVQLYGDVLCSVMKGAEVDGMTEISGITGMSSEGTAEQELGGFDHHLDQRPSIGATSASAVTGDAEELHTQIQNLKRELEITKGDLQDAQNVQAQAAEIMEDNEQLQVKIEELESELEKMSQYKESAESAALEVDRLKRDVEDHSNQSKKEKEDMKKRLDEAFATINESVAFSSKVENEKKDLTKKVTDQQIEIQTARDTIEELQRDQINSNELQSKLDEAVKMCDMLTTSEAEHKRAAEEKSVQLQAKSSEVEELQQQLIKEREIKEKEWKESQQERTQIQEQLGLLQVQLDQFMSENEQIRNDLSSKEGLLQEKQKSEQEASENVNGLNQRVQSLQNDLENAKEAAENERKKRQDLEAQMAKKVSVMEVELNTKVAQVHALQQEKVNVTVELETLRQRANQTADNQIKWDGERRDLEAALEEARLQNMRLRQDLLKTSSVLKDNMQHMRSMSSRSVVVHQNSDDEEQDNPQEMVNKFMSEMSKELEERQQAAEAYQVELKSINEDLSAQRSANEELQKQAAQFESQLQAETETRSELQREKEAVCQQIEHLNVQFAQEKVNLENQLAQVHENENQLTFKCQSLETQIGELNEQLQKVEERALSDNQQVSGVQVELQTKISAFTLQNEQLQQEIEQLRKEHAEMVEQKDVEIKEHQKQVQSLESQLQSIQSQMTQVTEKSGGQESRLVELVAALELARSQQAQLSEKMLEDQKQNEEKERSLCEQLKEAQSTTQDKEYEMLKVKAELQQQMSALEQNCADLQDVIRQSNNQNVELQDEKKIAQKEIDSLRQKLFDEETRVEDLNQQILEKANHIESLEAQVQLHSAATDEKSQLFDQQIFKAEEHINQLQSQIHEETAKLHTAQKQLQDEQQRYTLERDQLSARILALDNEIKQKERELTNYQQQADNSIQELMNQVEVERAEKMELEKQMQQSLEDTNGQQAEAAEAVKMAIAAKEAKFLTYKQQQEEEIQRLKGEKEEVLQQAVKLQGILTEEETIRQEIEQSNSELQSKVVQLQQQAEEEQKVKKDLQWQLDEAKRIEEERGKQSIEKENSMLIQRLTNAKLELAEAKEQILLLRKEVHRKAETNMVLASKLTKMEAQVYKKIKR